uniref:Uncharacterized protein n=1 Tax=Molossus molossus TaxID=27622 RepID=A0A7J8I111_MOLMO|nr:hypothetical protein HJG59_010842 [Molossus molossus]
MLKIFFLFFSFFFPIETKSIYTVFSDHPFHQNTFSYFPWSFVFIPSSANGGLTSSKKTQESLWGPKVVLEGVSKLYCSLLVDLSERSNPQISSSVEKDTFLLIIFVNSHCIILASYYVKKKKKPGSYCVLPKTP